MYMNDFDLYYARRRFTRANKPNRLALVMVVDNLRKAVNSFSDGWAYSPKACRAAKNAMVLIQSTTNAENDKQEATDISDAEMRAAVRPIKAYLTRNKVPADVREWILRATEDGQ